MSARATSFVLAGLLMAGLTGCTFSAVQANQKFYDPSDGVGATVGDVDVRNALLISEDGETANFVVSFINSSSKSVTLNVSWEVGSERVDRRVSIDAGTSRSFGNSSEPIEFEGIDTAPGDLFPVYFQYGSNEGEELLVPVLDGALPEYADLVPESGE